MFYVSCHTFYVKSNISIRRRRKSSNSSAARAGARGLSPSPRSKSGRTRLRLEVATPGLSSRKVSHESQPTPIPTVSEMSEGFLSPKSPLFDILNIRDISEVISEDIGKNYENNEEENDEEEPDNDDDSQRLSDLLMEKIAQEKSAKASTKLKQESFEKISNLSLKPESETEPVKPKERNPFHFNASKLQSFEKSDSEPKASKKIAKSNKKRNEILESESLVNSVVDERDDLDHEPYQLDSDSETLKEVEVVEKKTRRRWQKEPIKRDDILQFARPPLPQESSFESGCYYCRNVCKAHQSLLISEIPQASVKRSQVSSEEVGVQAGKSTIHHYLFDPTEDAVFENIHRPRQDFSHTNIDTNKIDIATSSVIDLMRRQLELMEHSVRSQQQLYRSFCRSLEKSQQRRVSQQPEDRVLFGKSRKPVKLTFDEALRQVKEEMRQEKQDMRDLSRSFKSLENRDKDRKHSRSISAKSLRNRKSHDSSIAENIEEYETDFETEIQTDSQITQSHESSQ